MFGRSKYKIRKKVRFIFLLNIIFLVTKKTNKIPVMPISEKRILILKNESLNIDTKGYNKYDITFEPNSKLIF